MLEVRNVTKKFIKKNKNNQVEEFKADDNISFTAKEGEVVGIIGPNGAGKTTLLRMIAGIMEPTSGEVLIDNKTHQEDMIGIKKKIAFLSGNTKLYKDISPYELLEMAGNYYEVDEKTLEKRIKDIVKKFNMSSFLNQKISTLSTGQYQRTSIARCLVHNPD